MNWYKLAPHWIVFQQLPVFPILLHNPAAALNTGALGFKNILCLSDNILLMVAILVEFSSKISLYWGTPWTGEKSLMAGQWRRCSCVSSSPSHLRHLVSAAPTLKFAFNSNIRVRGGYIGNSIWLRSSTRSGTTNRLRSSARSGTTKRLRSSARSG